MQLILHFLGCKLVFIESCRAVWVANMWHGLGCWTSRAERGITIVTMVLVLVEKSWHCHAPNMFGTVNMEHTIDSRLSWSKQWVWPMSQSSLIQEPAQTKKHSWRNDTPPRMSQEAGETKEKWKRKVQITFLAPSVKFRHPMLPFQLFEYLVHFWSYPAHDYTVTKPRTWPTWCWR